MRCFPMLVLCVVCCALPGCHSAYVDATLSNRTDKALTLVELDYPSASFGVQTLNPGQDFHYRFKILGSGDLKLIYTDTAQKERNVTGPSLSEGQEGTLQIVVTAAGTQWNQHLRAASSH